jgi:hypothetical protein
MKFVISLSLIGLLAGCAPTATGIDPTSTTSPTLTELQTGVLEGNVKIGPLQPVEQEGVPTPTIPPEVFTSRSLNIFQADGATLVVNVPFQADGTYRVELPPGRYVVDVPTNGLERGIDLPKTVTIEGGQTTRLDIEIDTGIR